MQTPYDIIIIGSGLGGLLSAVLLAKEGKKVCVLEKNNQYGGNLQTFVRNKIIFDTGVHYAGSLHNKQILYRYFDYAGIATDLELERLDLLPGPLPAQRGPPGSAGGVGHPPPQ